MAWAETIALREGIYLIPSQPYATKIKENGKGREWTGLTSFFLSIFRGVTSEEEGRPKSTNILVKLHDVNPNNTAAASPSPQAKERPRGT